MSDTSTTSKKLSPLLITLIAVCGVLLLAVVAITFLLIGQNSGTPSAIAPTGASQSPSPEPSVTESSAPDPEESQSPVAKPEDKTTRFVSFSAPTSLKCDYDAEEKPKIQVSWKSANAVKAYWAPHKGDASDGTGYPVPVSGNQDNITDNPHEYDCGNGDHQDNTITLIGPNGEKVSKSWTVTEIRD